MRIAIAASLSVLVAIGAAAAAVPNVAPVDMTNFKFNPSALQLHAGEHMVLQLRNASGNGHSFLAPAFFSAARIDPASAVMVRKGRVEVPARSVVSIGLTPAVGQYPLKCGHTLHSTFGMTGSITVR